MSARQRRAPSRNPPHIMGVVAHREREDLLREVSIRRWDRRRIAAAGGWRVRRNRSASVRTGGRCAFAGSKRARPRRGGSAFVLGPARTVLRQSHEGKRELAPVTALLRNAGGMSWVAAQPAAGPASDDPDRSRSGSVGDPLYWVTVSRRYGGLVGRASRAENGRRRPGRPRRARTGGRTSLLGRDIARGGRVRAAGGCSASLARGRWTASIAHPCAMSSPGWYGTSKWCSASHQPDLLGPLRGGRDCPPDHTRIRKHIGDTAIATRPAAPAKPDDLQ